MYCDQRKFATQAVVNSSIVLIAQQDSVIRFEQWQQGGKKVKLVIDAQLEGERSEIDMRCGARLTDDQKQEISTSQLHQAPFTKSNCILYESYEILSKSKDMLYEELGYPVREARIFWTKS